MIRHPVTETVTELDQRTKDELAPICEAGRRSVGKCTRVAEWAVLVQCPVHAKASRGRFLFCTVDMRAVVGGETMRCGMCGGGVVPDVVSVVRL